MTTVRDTVADGAFLVSYPALNEDNDPSTPAASEAADELRADLLRAKCFDVSHVFESLRVDDGHFLGFEPPGFGDGAVTLFSGLPCLRPPYDLTLFEAPRSDPGLMVRDVACLVKTLGPYAVSFEMLLRTDDGLVGQLVSYVAEIDNLGRPGNVRAFSHPKLSTERVTFLRNLMVPFAQVVGHALSILSCRNARIVEHVPPSKLQAKRLRKGRPALVTWREIEIDTEAPLVRRERVDGEPGGHVALHDVRGHYADYREGAGLFGRTRCLVWRGPTIRGSLEAGQVSHVYSFKVHEAAL